MRKYAYLALGLLISGCTTIDSDEYLFTPEPMKKVGASQQPLTSIDKVIAGMTYEEVMALMGDKVKIGFQEGAESVDTYGAMSLRNPFRIEMLTVENLPHLVVFFVTQVNASDGQVTDDELTPVVFKDNIMLGKGWDFLEELRNK